MQEIITDSLFTGDKGNADQEPKSRRAEEPKNSRRKLPLRTAFVVVATSAVLGMSASNAMGQGNPTYRVTDLGLLFPGVGNQSEAYDISNQNHVVGWSDQSVPLPLGSVINKRAFLWMPDGSVPMGFPIDLTAGMNDLTVFAGADLADATSQAFAIIRNGTEVRITGQSSRGIGQDHGFFWEPIVFNSDPNERLIDIGDLGNGSGISTGLGITNSNPSFVVGSASISGASCVTAFKWDSFSEIMTVLQTPVGLTSVAYDIHEDLGDTLIGGRVDVTVCPNPGSEPLCPNPISEAAAWINLAAATLSQPMAFNDVAGEARDLNDAGNLVGWGTDPSDNVCRDRPLYWEDTAAVGVVLETVPSGEEGRALGINSNKDVVGVNTTVGVATIWESTGPGSWNYSNLNDLISSTCNWNLVEARAVNDNDWIVGWGLHDGDHRAFLMRPIETCLHDLDDDGEVSTNDLLTLLANWGPCPDVVATGQFCNADYDCNGDVGTTDLLALLANWGPCFIGASIPQNIQDCLNRYCCDPENLLALEKCLCIIDPNCDPAP